MLILSLFPGRGTLLLKLLEAHPGVFGWRFGVDFFLETVLLFLVLRFKRITQVFRGVILGYAVGTLCIGVGVAEFVLHLVRDLDVGDMAMLTYLFRICVLV